MSDQILPRGACSREGSSRRRSRPPETPASDSSVAPHVVSRVETLRGGSVDVPSSAVKSSTHSQSACGTVWQYTSTQRCLACGKLGCTECAARVDPHARRQRLEALRMNTPYERAKVARVVEEVRAVEERRRHKVEEQWLADLQNLEALEVTMRRLVSLVQQERANREDVLFAEAREWRQWMVAAEMHSVLAALVRHEKEARYALHSAERTDFANLTYQHECHRHLCSWARREAAARERLVLEEAATRDRLRAVEADGRHSMRSREMERMALQESCICGRDAIDSEWRAGIERLAELAAAHVSVLGEQWAERMELLAEAERGAVNIAREHEFSLRRMHDDMVEEGLYLEETVRLFAHQRANLSNMESAARNGLIEEWVAFYHSVFLQLKQDEERVLKHLHDKAKAREDALQEAVRHLQTITDEEALAFSELLVAEHRGREQCEALMADKACLRDEFVRRCLIVLSQLEQEEEQARRTLLQQRQRDAVGVADWIAHKERQREALLAMSCSEKAEIAKDEHHARFFVVSAMAEHEEGVRRWCARKAEEREEIVLEECEQRQQCVSLEELARETLVMLFQTHVERLGTLAQQRSEQLVSLQRQCLASTEGIQVEEADAWSALCALHAHGLEASCKATAYREQLELSHLETTRRSFLAQEEITSREALGVQVRLARRLHEEHAMVLYQERVHQLESAEHSARHLICVEVEEFYEYTYLQVRNEEIALIKKLEDQIAEELASRQQCMQEDARLYDESEQLVFPACDASGVPLDGPCDSGSAGWQMGDLKAQLVLQTLGNPSCSTTISAVCIDVLASVLDVVGTRRAEVAEHVARLERESQAMQKRVQSTELELLREKEKKSEYESRRQREAAERDRRLANDHAEKKREMERWAAEKRRLKEAEEALEEQKKALGTLRQNIHRQYKH